MWTNNNNQNGVVKLGVIQYLKMMIGCRAFNKTEIINLISKLKRFTSPVDRSVLESLIRKEVYHYNEVHHDCESVIDNLWKLIRWINERKGDYSRRVHMSTSEKDLLALLLVERMRYTYNCFVPRGYTKDPEFPSSLK